MEGLIEEGGGNSGEQSWVNKSQTRTRVSLVVNGGRDKGSPSGEGVGGIFGFQNSISIKLKQNQMTLQ